MRFSKGPARALCMLLGVWMAAANVCVPALAEEYYDESYDNNNINISNDIDYFERITNGAFFLCSNINSLELIKKEIIKQIEKENSIKFNLKLLNQSKL